MTRVPDLLTASRGLIAGAIVSLGFVGPAALEAVIALTMLGWTTDILDGRLARRCGKEPSWIGEREFAFDMMLVFSGLCYLVMAGFVPFTPAAVYVAVAAVCVAFFRSKSVTMSFATPLVALPLVIAYLNARQAAWGYLVWIALALLLDWRRFKGVVAQFIANYKAVARR